VNIISKTKGDTMADKQLSEDGEIVMDKSFLENQKRLEKELNAYLKSEVEFKDYYTDMREINDWLKEEFAL